MNTTISNVPAVHIGHSTNTSILPFNQIASNIIYETGTTSSTTAVIHSLKQRESSSTTSERISISISMIDFQVPLLSVLSYGNNSFLDTSSLSSIALLSGYCILAGVQLLFMAIKKPVDIYETMVYSLLLTAAIIVTSLMYHENYLMGIDGIKNYTLNLAGLSFTAIQVVYGMLKEHPKTLSKEVNI